MARKVDLLVLLLKSTHVITRFRTFAPFRPPLLKRPADNENNEHPSKKVKNEPSTVGPRLVFKTPGISSIPRKPLHEVGNEVAETDHESSKGFYNVLWRKVTGKKNKTWEGDALYVLYPSASVERDSKVL
ncbi:MAG: hypothetical protein Q9170_000616 [Blastenia crenularia]